jgi:hypothetical protein
MISLEDALGLLLAGVLFSVALTFILVECLIWKFVEAPLFRAASGGSMLLVGCAISGFVVYILAKVDTFQIQGFQHMGLYSMLMLLAIGSVFIYQIAKRMVLK